MTDRPAEMRCPSNPSRLLLKVSSPRIVDGNLIEVGCRDCAKRARRDGREVALVVHRFNVLGELIESEES